MKITEILLQELNERMKNKGYRLDIDSSVVSYLVERGYNPEFGARAIKRVIQDTVENVIANKIINESLTSGDKITLTASDLNE
jgi:ATP-dependent Clp protease ATP-binding subunit ClpB